MRKAWRAGLQAIWFVRAVRDEPHTELAFRRFDGSVRFTFGYAITFCEQFEVMNQRFHVALHIFTRRRRDFVVRSHHWTGISLEPLYALPNDSIRLTHFFNAYEISIVTIAVHADG